MKKQVEEAIREITHTEDWSGKHEVQSLIREHGKDWERKWGHPNGIYHDLRRVYPEHIHDINKDRNCHDDVFRWIDNFRSACGQLRVEGYNVETREANSKEEKKQKAEKREALKRGKK